MNERFKNIFPEKSSSKHSASIIGMIHLQALPGTPASKYEVEEIIKIALTDAAVLHLGGVDALMIENMHDIPYLNREVGPEIIAAMSVITSAIKKEIDLPLGVQVLAGANQAAIAVAKAAGLEFVRAEGFVFGHIADEGWMSSDAGALLRYRRMIDADEILVFTDIKKKHSSHATTADVDLAETAKAAKFFRSDGVVITGTETGVAANPDDIHAVKSKCKIPVLVGSGVTTENVQQYISVSDALIVGSYFKKDGYWENDVEYDRVAKFMEKVNDLR